MMMFKTFTGKTFNTASDANAWLNSMKKTGKFASIQNAEGKNIAWVNSKFGEDKMLVVEFQKTDRRALSFADFSTGSAQYKNVDGVVKAFGNLSSVDVVNVKIGHTIYKTLDNGMKIQINRDEFMQENGTYGSIMQCVVMEQSTDRKADLYIRVSYDGNYIAWGFGEDFVREIHCRDGLTRNYYRLSGIKKIG